MNSFRYFTWVACLVMAGCTKPSISKPPLTLATTTSTRDSGLLDELIPVFEKETGISVKVVAVGSGQALALGRRGDADVLLTHSPQAEQEFMEAGYGELREPVMHNDFVLVGPKSDPANIGKEKSIVNVFRQIAKNEVVFVSRGDDSGTHAKEKSIWREAGIEPQGKRYLSTGTGMAATLRMASEKGAYTISDRGTFLAQREKLDLVILAEGDETLHNPYTVIVVSSQKHPDINNTGAKQFAEFLRSPQAQKIIGEFGKTKYGQPLFFPLKPDM
ncbi:MAG: substrate-binding domain-containing protein [Planctomycetaceae bacterium]